MEGFSMEDKLRILKEVQDKEMADLERLKTMNDQEEKEPENSERETENNPEESLVELEKQLAQMKDDHRHQEEELQKKIENLHRSYTCSQCGSEYIGGDNFCGRCGNKVG